MRIETNQPAYLAAPGSVRDLDRSREPKELRLIDALAQTTQELATEHYKATHDALVPEALNLRGFEEYLMTAESPKAIIMVDATNLKSVNDKISHSRGDDAIKDTYDILRRSTRPGDIIARIGGDEFVIMLNVENPLPDEKETLPPEEDKRGEDVPVGSEIIDTVLSRIDKVTTSFLLENPDLSALGFRIAAGGAIWEPGSSSIGKLLDEAEEVMKTHKATQHEQHGKYRGS